MAIDAFTLVAQIVNFLILLFLLRAFLFRPVQRVMAERERRIAEEHAAAERARAEAEAATEALRVEHEEAARTRRERLAELEREVERIRGERLDEARAEAEAARNAWRDDLTRARREAADELRRSAPAVLADALRHGWRELADEELEDHTVRTFARRLAGLGDDTRAALAAAARRGPVTLATAFEPTRERRAALVDAVREVLGREADPTFERDPRLLAGVALRAGDLRVGWSVDDHLADLARAWSSDAVDDADGEAGGEAPPGPAAAASAANEAEAP